MKNHQGESPSMNQSSALTFLPPFLNPFVIPTLLFILTNKAGPPSVWTAWLRRHRRRRTRGGRTGTTGSNIRKVRPSIGLQEGHSRRPGWILGRAGGKGGSEHGSFLVLNLRVDDEAEQAELTAAAALPTPLRSLPHASCLCGILFLPSVLPLPMDTPMSSCCSIRWPIGAPWPGA